MNIFDTLADMLNISWMWNGIEKFAGSIILAIAILWVIIIIWVARNISQRTDNVWMQVFCIIIATLGGPLWLLIYRVIRPSLNTQELSIPVYIICRNCQHTNYIHHNYCNLCGKSITIACKECGEMIDPTIEFCGICGAPNLH